MLEVGMKAPDFELADQDGHIHRLSDYLGEKVILYFYPKDLTTGCSQQACSYARNYPLFLEKGVKVIGISKDSMASHKKFQQKYQLPFTLLSDPDKQVILQYDVYKEKKLYGKTSMGVVRTTYLIDENGIIIHALDKIKAAEDGDRMGRVIG